MKKILLFSCFLFSCSLFADRFDSGLKWHTLKTTHFHIIYFDPNHALAELYAAASEQAFTQLTSLFGEQPTTPIPILLADNTDMANGSATFLPYALIRVYPVLPQTGDSISHYENWIYELMIHELAHLFNMAPAHGFYRPFTYLFGNVVRPNAVLPRWYLEGLAVEVESRYSTHGRLRSPGTAAAVRAMTLESRWSKENIDQINESSIPTWPYGQRPYLFGSLLWHNLVEKNDLQLIADLNQRFSRRVPFILNPPLFEKTGQTWSESWFDLRQELTTQSQNQIDLIQKTDPMTELPFARKNEQQSSPAVSPNGAHLAYLSSPTFESSTLKLISRPLPATMSFREGSEQRWINVVGCTRLSWMPDSSGVVFDQLAIHQRYQRFRDIYFLPIHTTQPLRLTHGARASEPAVSPDGQKIVFIRSRAGGTEVVLLHMATKKLQSLLKAPLGLRLSQPTFVDDKNIVFIGRDRRSHEQLYRMNIHTKKREPLANIAPIFSSLRWTSEGLLATANRSGVSNVYLIKEAAPALALTNTTTEILQADYDVHTKEVLYSRLTADGRQLFATPFKIYQPPTVPLLPAQEFKSLAPAPLQIAKVATNDEDYSPWPYMLPRYWIPFIYPVENGLILQGSNQTFDPTERHSYSLLGSYDSVTKQTSYGVNYNNATLPVELGVTMAETNELLAAQSDRVTNRFYGVQASSYLPGLSNAWSSSLEVSQIQSAIPSGGTTKEVDRLGVAGQVSYNSSETQLVKASWGESFFYVHHTSFLPGDNRLAYDKTAGLMGLRWRGSLPPRHNILWQFKGSTAPRLGLNNTVALGDRTIGGNYLVSLINSSFLLRGYPSGALVGRSIVNSNLEYRLPVRDLNRGHGTFPLFLSSLEMALFVDAALVDGAYLSQKDLRFYRSRTDDIFTGTGLEFTFAGTAAYHMPVSLTLGLYYGLNDRAGGGFMPFISLGYTGHGGVDQSSQTSTRLRPASFAR